MQRCAFRTDSFVRPSTIYVALFNSENIAVDDSTDVSSIASEEPQSGDYERQEVNIDTSAIAIENDAGDYKMDVTDQIFLTEGSNKDVTAYAVIAEFESSEAGDSSPQPHILYTGDLSELRQLSEITELTVDNISMKLD